MSHMKKQILVLFLILCTLGSTAALAEDRPPLRIAGSVYGGYWKEHDIPIVTPNYHWAQGVALMQRENAPDLYDFSTGYVDFYAMKEAGVLADLSGSERIFQAVSEMRPEVQKLVTTEDGQIAALPTWVASNPVYWRQDAWDAAGLTAEDVPQSYTELLDFCESWMERIQKRPEKEVCITDTYFFHGYGARYGYIFWLTEMLVNSWEMQQHYAGETVNFDTPEFIALLERTMKVGKALHKAEPSPKKRHNLLPLFWNQAGGSGFEGWFNGGREEGLSHTVPFRITRDQPELMRYIASLMVVRKGSVWTKEAIGHMETLIPHNEGAFAAEVYPGTAPGAFGTGFIERITEGWIKDRDAYTGILSFAPKRTFFQYEGTMGKFIQGNLSAEKLAAKISVPKDDPNR